MYPLFTFLKNQPEDYWSDQEIVALLYLRTDRREVEHDGYCSDPGDDVGQWEYDRTEIYGLNQAGKDFFVEKTDHFGNIDLDFLKEVAESDQLGCDCGSNYCGYDGEVVIKSGRMISPEYLLDLQEQSNLETMAYFIGEKDNFSQDSSYYWEQAVNQVQELKLLSIQLTRMIERNRRSTHKRIQLNEALKRKGMTFRSDSKLCQKWINGESDQTLEEVVKTMAECKWCIEYHQMFEKMKDYQKLNPAHQFSRSDLFSLIKANILQEHPLPVEYPWMKAEKKDKDKSWFGW